MIELRALQGKGRELGLEKQKCKKLTYHFKKESTLSATY